VLKELPIYGSSRLGVYKVPAAGLQTDREKLTLVKRDRIEQAVWGNAGDTPKH
jgi:hypothetical protein